MRQCGASDVTQQHNMVSIENAMKGLPDDQEVLLMRIKQALATKQGSSSSSIKSTVQIGV